jgi:hypothetical protein
MKSKERAVARGLEKLYPELGDLIEPDDQFSPFDFECRKYISRMTRNDYDFKWSNKLLPNSTEFNKTAMIEKPVGYLPISDAQILIL